MCGVRKWSSLVDFFECHSSDWGHMKPSSSDCLISISFLCILRGRSQEVGKKEKEMKMEKLMKWELHTSLTCVCKLFRYLQKRKTINELPEPMRKLQRKAWREATRRHRAKKLAQAALHTTSMSQTPSLWPGLFISVDSVLSGQNMPPLYIWIIV